MGEKFVLAIDQGTTSSRAILFKRDGTIHGIGRQPLPQHYPKPGYVEHDPLEIWTGVQNAIAEVLHTAQVDAADVVAVGITNQRETTIAWDRATSPRIYPAIAW